MPAQAAGRPPLQLPVGVNRPAAAVVIYIPLIAIVLIGLIGLATPDRLTVAVALAAIVLIYAGMGAAGYF